MFQEPGGQPEADLERCRHGFTAGEFCAVCDEIDLRERLTSFEASDVP